MPTYVELKALVSNCDSTWTTENGVTGYTVRGRGAYASNSIFLPVAGYGDGTSLGGSGSYGRYWSSVPNKERNYSAFYLYFSSSFLSYSDQYRYRGLPVRPVLETINAVVEFAYSTDFLLNTEEKTLNLDIISYNSSWNGNDSSATVVISDNGVEIYRGSGEGEFDWQPTTVGKHTLTYMTYINDVAQGEVYEATVYSGFKYKVVDSKAVITEAAVDGEEIVIPSEIDGFDVVEIADGVFAGYDEIKDVTMPGALCLSLADIFPDSYASITNVTLIGNIAQLPTGAFAGCAALESVTLAQSGATLALGGDKGWRFDEGGVLRSGKITHNESSTMNMTVQGEGRLTYRWKASSEYYSEYISDYAYLSIDNEAKGSCEDWSLDGYAIGGETVWQECSIDVMGDTSHEIMWTYKKDSADEGVDVEDCIWVDSIKYEPFIKVSFDIAGAEGMIPDLMKDVCGASIILPSADGFAKAKHTFAGWSDGDQTYAPRASYQVGASDVVLIAVYEANTLAVPVISSADVSTGGEITSESATIEISAEDDTTIYYTIDGTTPTSESLIYSEAFEADGLGLVTIKAITVRDNYFDSEVAEFTFTRRPYSISECLNVNGFVFTLSGDAEWTRILGDAAHDRDAALQSGKISDNQKSVIETTVYGPGTISFWWKTSCQKEFKGNKLDYVSFIDCFNDVDSEKAYLAGISEEWTQITVDITESGEHTLKWVYQKNNSGFEGEDCAWLDEVVWTPAPVETQSTPVAVPFAWLKEKYPSLMDAAAFEAKASEVAANGVNKVWECFVAGIDPTDATAKFVTKIEMVDGKPVITWEPDMNQGSGKTGVRTYKLLGSTDLKTWAEVADGAESNFNFFKVEVSIP